MQTFMATKCLNVMIVVSVILLDSVFKISHDYYSQLLLE